MAVVPDEAFISGRRPSLLRFAWRLYWSDDSFRGLVDFAVIGAVVLAFLDPPTTRWVQLKAWAFPRDGSSAVLLRSEAPSAGSTSLPVVPGEHKAAVPDIPSPIPLPSHSEASDPAVRSDTAPPVAIANRDGKHEVASPAIDVPMPLPAWLKSERLMSPLFFVEIDEELFRSSNPNDQERLKTAAADYRAMRFDRMMDDLAGANTADANALFLRALGVMHQVGSLRFGSAKDLLQAAAEGGQQQATVLLGVLLVAGPLGVEKDVEKGRALIEAAAASDRMAQRAAGIGYISGEFGALDPARGAEWLKRAADTGDAPAMLHYGYLLSTGAGVDQNSALAEEYVRRAAAVGLTAAQATLGGWLLDRYKSGLIADPTEGIRWLTQAYEIGFSTDALVRLGLFYAQDGRGPWLDRNKSLALFKLCIGYASFSCQFAYANHLQTGLVTARDLVGAYARYQAARELGAASAPERLQALDRQLSADEKTKADELAKSIRGELHPLPAMVVLQYPSISVKPSPWQ